MFYKKEIEQVLNELETSINGLTSDQAKERLEKYGLNQLQEQENESALSIFLTISSENSPTSTGGEMNRFLFILL